MILVFILYDSIHNSVFAGQVWQVLIKLLAQNKYQKIILISFELEPIKLGNHNYQHSQINIIQIKRTRYFGRFSLILNWFKIIKYLPKTNYQIIARGPFAGYLAIKTNQLLLYKPQKITIQARGLAGAEYAYSNQTQNKDSISHAYSLFDKIMLIGDILSLSKDTCQNIFAKIRAWQLTSLEKSVYRYPQKNLNSQILIECVSPALKTYLIKSFGANQNNLVIAKNDLPNKIKPAKLAAWRKELRLKFKISLDAQVYCYSGSSYAWQCPNLIINFFKKQLTQDPQAFLLILTNEPAVFAKIINTRNIKNENYLILNVPHQIIYQYLAIANYGLLFRENNIINWVSRPTKALEYDSANLPIIHNNTVAWLANKKKVARI